MVSAFRPVGHPGLSITARVSHLDPERSSVVSRGHKRSARKGEEGKASEETRRTSTYRGRTWPSVALMMILAASCRSRHQMQTVSEGFHGRRRFGCIAATWMSSSHGRSADEAELLWFSPLQLCRHRPRSLTGLEVVRSCTSSSLRLMADGRKVCGGYPTPRDIRCRGDGEQLPQVMMSLWQSQTMASTNLLKPASLSRSERRARSVWLLYVKGVAQETSNYSVGGCTGEW